MHNYDSSKPIVIQIVFKFLLVYTLTLLGSLYYRLRCSVCSFRECMYSEQKLALAMKQENDYGSVHEFFKQENGKYSRTDTEK
jgi:hypothetical protein